MLSKDFIEDLIASKRQSTVFLVNGVKLSGKITKQDDDCFVMTCKGDRDPRESTDKQQLVFIKAVSTIQ